MHIWILGAIVVAVIALAYTVESYNVMGGTGYDVYYGRDLTTSSDIALATSAQPGIKGCQDACTANSECVGVSLTRSPTGKKDTNGQISRQCRLKRAPVTVPMTNWYTFEALFSRNSRSTLYVKRPWRQAMKSKAAANAKLAKETRARTALSATRTEWPEVVGMTPDAARIVILATRPTLDVSMLPYGGVVSTEYNANRVRVFYDNTTGRVLLAPFIN